MAESAKKGGDRLHPASSRSGRTPQIPSSHGPALDRTVQAQIGDKLRTMYGELVEQPVPDRLADLLRQLDLNPK
jgi:hypothetical protein